jgi:hypothetical protein
MKRTILVVALAISTPAAAQQTRVYTNADLAQGRPITRTRTPTAEELRGLEERQFKFQPSLPDGPRVVGVWSSPTAGPFGEFPHYRANRFDGLGWYDYSWGFSPYRPYAPIGRVKSPGLRAHRGARHLRRSAGRVERPARPNVGR